MLDDQHLSHNGNPHHPGRTSHLLDREVPEEYLREWTSRISTPKEDITRSTSSVVIFRLGDEWLALPTTVFQEVVDNYVVRTIPHRRSGPLLGLVNVRGELLLCVTLRGILGHERSVDNRPSRERLLVLNKTGRRFAFPVDEISGIHRYHPREIVEAPATVMKSSAVYISGVLRWEEKTIGCLDEEALLETLNRSFS